MSRNLTSRERVAASIREMILSGDLHDGARLGEVELADLLGVSRTPVREALNRLGAEGLVEITPNRGARVATWSLAEIEGVFDLRSVLEPRLTELATAAAMPEDIDELDALARRMLDAGLPGRAQDLDALVPLNREFHDRLAGLAGHPTLAHALAAAVRTPIQTRNFHVYDEGAMRRSLGHHVEIVDALRAHDAVWARAVMTAHIHSARAVMVSSVVEALGARGAARQPPDPLAAADHDPSHHLEESS